MTHPTPWQLELYALGEDVPAVIAHLPCPVCDRELRRMTTDPGPVPLGLLESAKPPPTPRPWWPYVLAAAVTTILLGGGLVARLAPLGGGTGPHERGGDAARTVPSVPNATPQPRSGRPEPVPSPSPDPQREAQPRLLDRPAGTSAHAAIGIIRRADGGIEGHVYTPTPSVSGQHIAFERNDLAAHATLGIVGSRGRESEVRLPGGGGPFGGKPVLVGPVWHPQEILVFEGSNTGGTFRLFYFQPGSAAASEMISEVDRPGDLTFPVIDPKGTQMAFASEGDLFVRSTNTGRISRVLETPEEELFPTFSPDGGTLAFERKHTDGTDLYTLDLTTGVERVLRRVPGDQTRPVFVGPDRVAYFAQDGEDWSLELVADGRAEVLAEGVRLPLRQRPAVSPNGEWLAWTLEDPTQSGDVWLSRADGTLTLTVPTGLGAVGEPALFVRDGTPMVAFTALPDSGADWRGLYITDIADDRVEF